MRALRADAPPRLADLVARCMRKPRDERYHHAQQLQAALLEIKL